MSVLDLFRRALQQSLRSPRGSENCGRRGRNAENERYCLFRQADSVLELSVG